jgi:copper chaperone CopZ
METKTYSVPNISCQHCTHTITMELSDLQGVHSVEADVHTKQVTVSFEPPATEELIKNTLAEINYPAAT